MDDRGERIPPEGERGLLGDLEEKIEQLLARYQDLKKERDDLLVSVGVEREKSAQLEKKLELLSQDRDKVKIRIDQLLSRLKSIDVA